MFRSLFVFVVIMMTVGTSMAESVSKCSVDTLPIQIVGGAGHGDVTTLSDAKIVDFPPGFTSFVTVVTEHIAVKLAQEKFCLESTESKERSLLQFVSWSIHSGPLASVPQLEAQPSGVCRISSPWVDLAIERKPVPSVRGIFRYNERQLLADQAVMAGAGNVPPGVALPLTRKEFDQYADLEYAPSEIRHQPTEKPIEERVPPDLLWLFRRASHSPEDNFIGLSGSSMRKAMRMSADGYTRIVTTLIDQCFASEGVDIHYNSILDVANLIPLGQYKIVTSITVTPIR